MIKAVIKWSEPIEIFKLGEYNTDEKFIQHLKKFISENDSPLLDQKGIWGFFAGSLIPERKLSTALIEGSFDRSIREAIEKKKGHMREYKCVYKNYKEENLYLRIGIIESLNTEGSEEVYQKIVCKLIDENDPSCNEKCDIPVSEIEVINTGDFYPLKEK